MQDKSIEHQAQTTKRRSPNRTKSGCTTCRERRVKCDERKPLCRRCAISNRTCRGYWYGNGNGVTASLLLKPSVSSKIDGFAEMKDLVDLIPLTVDHLAQACMTSIPDFMPDFLLSPGGQLLSYLPFLPSMLGHDASLDSAIRCMSAALRLLFVLPTSKPALLQKCYANYADAIKGLRQGLNDPKKSVSMDLYCTSAILCSFECLTTRSDMIAVPHSKGGTQMTIYRGPQRFSTELEKNLFISTISVFIMESFFQSKPCILNDGDWLTVLRDTVLPDSELTDRHETVVSLYECLIPITATLANCSEFILGRGENEGKDKHELLLQDLNAKRSSLLRWYEKWSDFLVTPTVKKAALLRQMDQRGDFARRLEIYILYQAYDLICNRYYVALDGDHGYLIEQHSQRWAADMVEFYDLAQVYAPRCRGVISLRVARLILDTSEAWETLCPSVLNSRIPQRRRRRLVDSDVFLSGTRLVA